MKSFNEYWDGLLFGKEGVDKGTARQVYGHVASMCRSEITKLQADREKLIECVKVSTNQLRGCSLAIATHGQNINTQFFIVEYEAMAKDKEQCLKELNQDSKESGE